MSTCRVHSALRSGHYLIGAPALLSSYFIGSEREASHQGVAPGFGLAHHNGTSVFDRRLSFSLRCVTQKWRDTYLFICIKVGVLFFWTNFSVLRKSCTGCSQSRQ